MVTRDQEKQSCTDVGVTDNNNVSIMCLYCSKDKITYLMLHYIIDLAIRSISMTENDVNKRTTYLMMILYFVEKDFVILSCVSMLRL